MRWCSLTEVADRSGADAEAVYYAVQHHWIEVSPGQHSVCLTEEGRQALKARN
jgi:hypothetical protein